MDFFLCLSDRDNTLSSDYFMIIYTRVFVKLFSRKVWSHPRQEELCCFQFQIKFRDFELLVEIQSGYLESLLGTGYFTCNFY